MTSRSGLLVAAALLLAGASLIAHAAPKKRGKRGWDRYTSRAKTLKKYRESKSLDDSSVLQLLKDEGVFKIKPKHSQRNAHRSFARGFRPFKVRVYRGLWRWPLKYGIVSSEYGRRWGRRHKGIDIAADPGDKIYAVAPGEVLYASSSLKGYGNVVILRHDEETVSLYAHTETLRVRKGQRVTAGKIIATIGSTGRSTGPHVHFEVRRGGKAIDPRKLLPKSRF